MRRFGIIVSVLVSMALAAPSVSADALDLFGAILGEMERQAQRAHNDQLAKQIRPAWEACSRGDIAGCDAAATYPLNPQGRAQLARMRDMAVRRPAFERNWIACQSENTTACDQALAYPYLAQEDSLQLLRWRRTAVQAATQKTRQKAAYEQLVKDCGNGIIAKCERALTHPLLTPSTKRYLNQQRSRIESTKLRQTVQDAFRKKRQRCLAGDRNACAIALTDEDLSSSERTALERQHDTLTPLSERALAVVKTLYWANDATSRPASAVTRSASVLLHPVSTVGLVAVCMFVALLLTVWPGFAQPAPSQPPNDQAQTPSFPITGHLPTDVRFVLKAFKLEGSS